MIDTITKNRKKEIIVFAGPNGSGKSTITNFLQVKYEYINADAIKRATNCTDLEAAIKATEMREDLLNRNKDFAFETVLSTERNLDLLKRAKAKDYFIRSYFILTKDVNININRIEQRVLKGGHGVPVDKIRSRYLKSIDNLKELIRISDICNVYDNSNAKIRRIFKKRKEEYYFNESKHWNKNEIIGLTGIAQMIEKDLNNF